jgi:long-chain acyl-CoA synthetase
VTLGEYEWLSFNQVGEMVENVGAGLQAIGHSAEDRVVIFAETRMEWLVTALACFRKGFTGK